ncbi:MAG: RHS repeat protein, partial [Anaerolineae bacterium]|nr:RHS repeat protein [Anaerolineae bacterium]
PTSPTDTDLDGKAALEYTLVWRGNLPNDSNYVTTRQTYYSSGANVGLPYETITYKNYSTSAAFATTVRNTTRVTGYNVLGLPTGSQTLAAGLTTLSQSVSYDSLFAWLPATTTDANGAVTGYKYDKFGRLTKVIRPGDTEANPTVSYSYWDNTANNGTLFTKPLLIQTAYNGSNGVRQFYDGLGRLVQEQAPRSNVRYGSTGFGERDVIATYAYDARGLLTCQTMPYDVAPYVWNGQTPYRADNCLNYAHSSTTYDMLGRVVKTIAPDNTTTSHHHYGVWIYNNELITYDDVIDANRHRTQYNYDAWGRLVKVHEISGDCGNYWSSEGYGCSGSYVTPWAVYATTTYGYNERNQLVNVWDNANNNTQMSYNALGHKLTMSDPDMGPWSYEYDTAGNLSQQVDANSKRLCFFYDDFNRLIYKRHDADNDGCETTDTQLAAYSYGDAAASYNLGRLIQVVDASGTHTFAYDSRGRVTGETRTLTGAPAAYTMNYGYDALDRLTSQTYPNGETVATTYNNQGLPNYLSGSNTYVDA